MNEAMETAFGWTFGIVFGMGIGAICVIFVAAFLGMFDDWNSKK